MTDVQIVFLLASAVTLASGLAVVTMRNLFHAALMLMVSLFGVAVFYVLLEAPFLAAAQVLIYIGAIAILIMFAVMLTRRVMNPVEAPMNSDWRIGAVVSVLVLVVLILALLRVAWTTAPPTADLGNSITNSIAQLGLALVRPDLYALPFEVASVMLLAALVGSIVIAREKK